MKRVKISVFTEDSSATLTYKVASNGVLILKTVTVRPLPESEASGRSVDPLFPIPLTWNGSVHALGIYIWKNSSYVTSVFRL